MCVLLTECFPFNFFYCKERAKMEVLCSAFNVMMWSAPRPETGFLQLPLMRGKKIVLVTFRFYNRNLKYFLQFSMVLLRKVKICTASIVHILVSIVNVMHLLCSMFELGENCAGIFKPIRNPGINSKKSIPPAYVANAGIINNLMGARNRVGIELSYRPAWLHRLAEFIPWNRFLGSIKV